MAPRASCKTCQSRDRASLEALRASGTSFAELARRFGQAEPTIRRHFKRGHARASARPAPVARPAPAVTRHTVTMEHLRNVAAEFSLPIEDMVFHHVHCRKGDIDLVDDAEGDELLAMMREYATDEEFQEMFGG